MDTFHRNRYLEAIGVDVWVRRPGGPLEALSVPERLETVSAQPAPLTPAALEAPEPVSADVEEPWQGHREPWYVRVHAHGAFGNAPGVWRR